MVIFHSYVKLPEGMVNWMMGKMEPESPIFDGKNPWVSG